MNKLFLFLLCLTFFVACGSDDDHAPSITEKTISYKFNTNAAPTGTNNLIGVQIYKGVKSGDLVRYSPYAYGIFDDFSKIKLELPKDAEYKIVSTVVVDGKGKVVKDGNGYLKPFSIQGNGVALTNYFTLSSDKAMTLLNQSTTTMIKQSPKSTKDSPTVTTEPKDYETPNLDRYYGEVTDYSGDSAENPTVDMQRQVFGIRFTAEFEGNWINPDDCMYLVVQGAPDTLFIYAKDAVKTIEAMYTFTDFNAESPNSVVVDAYSRLANGKLMTIYNTGFYSIFKNYLTVLDQKMIADETGWSFPNKWSIIDEYYTDRGSN